MADKGNNQPVQQLEVISLKPKGLWTYPNTLSAVPQGSLLQAVNVVLSRPEVIEQRRGMAPVGTVLTNNIDSLYSYQSRMILHNGTTFAYDSDGFFTWVNYSGSYSAPTGAIKIRSIQQNKNLYFTTSTGFQKLDSLTGAVTFSGAPAGLDGSGSTTGAGWFTNNTQVAYRIVFGYTDANQNLILGAPSQRIVVSNSSGGATNVSLTFTLPSGLTTAWQYQIYRSPMSIDLNTEPNDECALVYTGNPTAGELTAGAVTVIDSINDSLKGAFIYTASSQEGISQANYQAPLAVDAATFKGFTFLANVTPKQQADLTLVSVGGTGLVVNDTVTIGGTTYTGKAAENVAAAEFKVSTGGTPSQNITNTANSLVHVINRYSGNTTINAYYSSDYSELPGQILLEERIIGGAAFTSSSSRSTAFVPDIGTTTLSSSAENTPNFLQISKYLQPEAYPIGQTLSVGSEDKKILRIIALRDYLLVFKEDGVYQVAGTDINSFAVQEVDKTTILQGIETAVALNNKVYCFTNQTVVSITYNEGAVLKSLPIKKDLLVISSSLYPQFDTLSFAVAYESENQYILGTISNVSDTGVTNYYVYNYLTDTWTTWQYGFTFASGLINPVDNKLYFGSSDSTSRFVYQERKTFTDADFADNSYPITIVSSVGTIITVASSASAVVGYSVAQNDLVSKIVSIPDATHIVVLNSRNWVAGDAAIYTPINISLKFVPEACGNPGIVKHFKECHAIFSMANFEDFDLGFYTDFYTSINFSTLIPKNHNTWGSGPWGLFPWGGGAPEFQVIRGIVPIAQRRGHWINFVVNYSDALTNFALDGFTLFYSSMSQRFH
jgi:hypothetical protein